MNENLIAISKRLIYNVFLEAILKMKTFRSFFTFSLITMISRCFGFLRDILFASVMSTGVFSDAFFFSFRLITTLKALVADGPISAVFVPAYIKKDKENKAVIFAQQFFSTLLIFAIVACLTIYVLTPFIIKLIAPGFNDFAQFQAAVMTFRIMIPYLFFIAIAAFFGCILQAKSKVYGTAILPLILNIMFIAGAMISQYKNLENVPIIRLMSIMIAGAGFFQLVLLFIMIRINKIKMIFRRDFWQEDVKKSFKKLSSTMVSSCLNRTNILINNYFASKITGLSSYMYYADRIAHLPISLIGVAMNVAFLPEISKIIHEKPQEEVNETLNRIIEFIVVLSAPIALLISIFSHEIIYYLFYRGKFNLMDVTQTAQILRIFAISIPAMIMSQVLITNFFARHDTRTPMLISLCSLAINLFGNLILMNRMENGVVIAYIISNLSHISLVLYILHRKKFFNIDQLFILNLKKIVYAMAGMIFVAFLGSYSMRLESWIPRSFLLLFIAIAAIFTYLLSIFRLDIYDIKDLRQNFKYVS